MPNVGELTVKLKGDASSLDKALSDVETKLKSVGGKFKNIGKGMSAGITAPIAGIGVSAIMTGAKFEQGMNRVKALTQASGSEFDSLTATAKELGKTTMFSATQSAEAMGFLAMAGFKTTSIVGAMPGVLNLAAAAQMDLGQAADITSNILTGFGKETADLAHVNDVLVKAMTSANVDLSMLGESMKFVGPVAKSAGMGFEETAAAVALLGNAGIQGSMAGTALRGAMTKLLTPTDEAATIMAKLGVNALDSEGNLKSFTSIIGDLESSGASTADMMTIFGQRAGPAMMALVSQGSGALADMTESLENSGGIAKSVADTQMQGLNGAITEMKSAFEGLMIVIAEDILPIITKFVDKLSPLLRLFADAPQPIKIAVLAVAGIAAVVGPLLILIGFMIPAITALSGVMGVLSISMGPITLIVLGIAAAIAAIIIVWKNWDRIVDVFNSTITGLKELWNKAFDSMKSTFSTIAEKIKQLYNSKLGWLLPGGTLILAIEFLQTHWDTIWNGMKSTAETVMNGLKSYVNLWIKALNFLIGGMNKISFEIPNIPGIPGRGTKFGINIPEIPYLAKGGIVNRPTLAMIGERGPEAVIPLGRGVGGGITINILGPTYGFDDFSAKVSQAVRDGVRRGGYQGVIGAA
jgi:TP901 family phage tail tape measure protein